MRCDLAYVVLVQANGPTTLCTEQLLFADFQSLFDRQL
jgi:hypothetical protein